MKTIETNIELTALFVMLKDHGASHIVINFNGSGDEGAFDEMHAIPSKLVNEHGDLTDSMYSGEFQEVSKMMPEIPKDKISLLEDLASTHTSAHDWWNNDGGDGYIVINMTKLTFHTHYSINHMTTDEHSESGKILEE